MITLSQSKFLQIQKKFFATLKGLPVSVILTIQEVSNSIKGFDALMKTSSRVTINPGVVAKALYKQNISDWERTKYSLNQDISIMVWLSPLELLEKFGTFKVDKNKTNIVFIDLVTNDTYVIKNVIYREPLYNSCIAVELHIAQVKNT